MALTLMTLTACDVLDSFFGNSGEEGGNGGGSGTSYSVTLELDGGNLWEHDVLTSYTAGTTTKLPTPSKDYYTFDGWYKDSEKTKVATEIPSTATGNKTYYAKWTPETYQLTFTIKNDSSYKSSLISYTYGTETTLPTPEKSGSTFNGWYTAADLSGGAVTKIEVGTHGNKDFYGEWKSGDTPAPSPTKSKVTLNLDGGTLKTELKQYTEGVETKLPEIEKTGYSFNGWYNNAQFNGDPVTHISKNATGAQEFWASWTKVSADTLSILASSGYEEGAYVEFNQVTGVSSYSVAYKLKDSGSYTPIDSQLVRVNNSTGKVRADVVGIKKGEYTLQVTAGSQAKTTNVSVKEYDRSGYAHFDSSKGDKVYANGVGGYNNDGTKKSNAEIIYVTNSTKNTVTATIKGTKYTGLVKILQNLSKDTSKSYIIRIIGRIEAATWQEINYTKTGSSLSPDEVIKQTTKLKNITLSKKNYTQGELEGMGFKYDASTYSRLDNLEGQLKYDSSKTEFDSCWNDCQISNAQNVTIEGIGTDAGLFQWGMTWKKCKSIEIRNLTFSDYTEDACSFEGSTSKTEVDSFETMRIWMHHNTFNIGKNYWDVCKEQDKHDGDGATDFKGVSYVTIAYNRYNGTHKTGLIGGGSGHMSANITFHHNYYNSCSQRLPLARQANMHMYNNYYHNSSTSLSLRANAYAFVEYCYFDGSNNTMIEIQSYDESQTGTYAVAKVYNCQMSGKGYNYDKMPKSEMPSDKSKADSRYIKFVDDRTATVSNNCTFCKTKNFDIDSTKFYYDATNKCSKVTDLITDLSSIPTEIEACAGVRH
ncbi:MAG: InlB B-repeat-containing protein [Clostridia bacterium]|nr:InlB B-repeat-containing protein [Clostridia bacterium]